MTEEECDSRTIPQDIEYANQHKAIYALSLIKAAVACFPEDRIEHISQLRRVDDGDAWPDDYTRKLAREILRREEYRPAGLQCAYQICIEFKLDVVRFMDIPATAWPAKVARDLLVVKWQRDAKDTVKAGVNPDVITRLFDSIPVYSGPEKIAKTPGKDWKELAKIDQRWLFDRRIPLSAVTVLASPGGMGKSTIARGLLLSVCLGRELFRSWAPCVKGPVLYMSGEDDEAQVYRSMNAYLRDIGLDSDESADAAIQERFHLRALNSFPMLSFDKGGNPSTTPEYAQFEALAMAIKPRLIVIDVFRKYSGIRDENSNAEAGKYLALISGLAEKADAAILLLAHANKASAKENDPKAYSVRGAGAICDESRSVFTCINEENRVKVCHVKSNFAKPLDPCYFVLEHGAAKEEHSGYQAPDFSVKSEDVIRKVSQWLRDNPTMEISIAGIKKNKGDCRHLHGSVVAEFKSVTPGILDGIVSQGLASGALLDVVSWSDNNRKNVNLLKPGFVAQEPTVGSGKWDEDEHLF